MSIVRFNSKYLIPLLEKINREDKFCFLMVDFNSMLQSVVQGLLTNQKFNSFEFTSLSGNINHWISSHLIQFIILEDLITPKPPPKSNVYKRNLDNFDSNKLKEDFYKIEWINEILMMSMKHLTFFTKLLVKQLIVMRH